MSHIGCYALLVRKCSPTSLGRFDPLKRGLYLPVEETRRPRTPEYSSVPFWDPHFSTQCVIWITFGTGVGNVHTVRCVVLQMDLIFLCDATAKFGPRLSHLLRFLDHTQLAKRARAHAHTHTHARARGRTPLNEWSARPRGRYLHNTQQTQRTCIYALGVIRIAVPLSAAAGFGDEYNGWYQSSSPVIG